ncbi:MAG: radical SAM protein [Deltaproteobacteria bacterium]|nr:radical SAM protein [Deltaproteobacteria bacterium]
MTACTRDILLLFPPHWAFTMPHLALPCLHGALAAAGHDATLLDANLDFHRWLFSSDGVEALDLRIRSQIDRLEEKSTISSTENARLRNMVVGAAVAQRLRAEIDHAAKVLSSEEFFDPRIFTWATDCISTAYGLVGRAFFPSRLDFVSFHSIGNPATREGLAEITQDDFTNPYRDFFTRHTIPLVRDLNPRLIGISIAAETQWVAALTLCRMLRESDCTATVVLGGGVPTRLADILATPEGSLQDYCDIIVTGEGEDAIVEMADRISRNKPVNDVEGSIAYLTDGKIQRSPARGHTPFRRLPAPVFSGLCLSRYFTPKPVLPVMLARGCYHRCAFCDHSAAYSSHRSARSPADVVAEMKTLQRLHGTTCFAFADEALPVAAIRGLSTQLSGGDLQLSIAASFRGEANIHPEDWSAFAHAGLRLAQFGIESGSQKVLDAMRKGTVVASVEASLSQAGNAGIWNHGFIMFGFPGETQEDVAETIAFLERNRKRLHSVGASQFKLMRKSIMAANPAAFRITMGDADLWSLVHPYVPSYGMTVAEANVECTSFNRNILSGLSGAPLWHRLERSQLLLYLERYSREMTLALGDDNGIRRGDATSLQHSQPIDVELAHMWHDVTDSMGDISRSGSPLPLVVDGRSRSVSLLSDEAWAAVHAWRNGNTLSVASRSLSPAFGGNKLIAEQEIAVLWSDLSLAESTPMQERPLFIETPFLNLRAAIEAPEDLPNSALPEWLGVVSGIKPGMRITLYGWSQKRLEKLARHVMRSGLAVRFGEFLPDGLAHLSPHERSLALAAAPIHAYIARTAVLADRLVEAEGQGATAFGSALGYPDCCVRWLTEQDAESGPWGRPANLPVVSLRQTSGQCCAELNNLLWYLSDRPSPFYLISHYPCSYRCRHSRTLARTLHNEIARCSADAARSMEQALSQPVVIWDDTLLPQVCWDENKGLAFDGDVILNRIRFNAYVSLRKERDYSDLGLAFSDELMVTEDRVLGMTKGRTTGCWWAAEHGRAHIFNFRWESGEDCS